VLNLISLGAAYGIIVFIFQWGHGSEAIWGVPATGAIISWIPLMIFAFLSYLHWSRCSALELVAAAADRPRAAGAARASLSKPGVSRCLAPNRGADTSRTSHRFVEFAAHLAFRTCLHAWHRDTPLVDG
jgi:hypothetical protein